MHINKPLEKSINAQLLKEISKQMTTPLTHIINISFAKVIAIYKMGDRKLPENYRPISLLLDHFSPFFFTK